MTTGWSPRKNINVSEWDIGTTPPRFDDDAFSDGDSLGALGNDDANSGAASSPGPSRVNNGFEAVVGGCVPFLCKCLKRVQTGGSTQKRWRSFHESGLDHAFWPLCHRAGHFTLAQCRGRVLVLYLKFESPVGA